MQWVHETRVVRYGYARVSTKAQELGSQLTELASAGVADGNIFQDVGVSGKRAARPGLSAMLKVIERGDEVVVVKLDRLGRSMLHTSQLAADFREQGVGFRSLRDGVDTSTASGRMMFGLLATFAEYEREMIVERTLAGLEHARENGRVGGRKPVMQRPLALQVKALVDGGLKPTEIAKQLKVSRATAYRYLDTYECALSDTSVTGPVDCRAKNSK